MVLQLSLAEEKRASWRNWKQQAFAGERREKESERKKKIRREANKEEEERRGGRVPFFTLLRFYFSHFLTSLTFLTLSIFHLNFVCEPQCVHAWLFLPSL